MARVLVLGGGFGGLAAANELRSVLPPGDEIVLVSASDRFFMGFAKLWDLGGLRPLEEGTRPLAALDRRGIRFLHAEVTALDPASLVVSTTAGDVTGDALLVALGTVPVPAHLDLLDGHGHNLYDHEALPRMRAAIDGVVAGRVLIAILGTPFKCPPAPYEAALLVDEWLRQRGVRQDVAVDVVTPQPMALPAAGPEISRVVAGYLAQQDIGLLERRTVAGIDGEGPMRRVELGDEHLDCSVVLGVPAEKVPPVIETSPLGSPSSFIEPDPGTLRTSFPGVYAVGDCTLLPTATAQLPKAGVFAASQGRVAARNIARDLHGGAEDEAAFDGRGQCFLELPGRRVALVEGNFFAQPRPDVRLVEASEANFELKEAYERDRLSEWLA